MNAPVLIVANDPGERDRLRGEVERCGHATVACDVPSRYVPARGKATPRAAVVDADDGLEALSALSRHCARWPHPSGGGKGVPILAVTQARRLGEMEALWARGAADCLSKPIDPERLARKLERLTRPRNAGRPEAPEPLRRRFDEILRRHGVLGDGAAVHGGALPRHPGFRRLAPPDSRWRGVLAGREIVPFRAPKPSAWLYWHKRTLFHLPAPEEYAVAKVVVRRLGPPMAAAVELSGHPVAGDALAVVPHEAEQCGAAACVLNSRLMDFYFNRLCPGHAGGSTGLTTTQLAGTPWVWPDPSGSRALDRIAKLLKHYGERPASPVDRLKRRELLDELNDRVFGLYGFGAAERQLLGGLYF